MISPLTIILGGLGRPKDKIPAFFTGTARWLPSAYAGNRISQMRWLNMYELRSNIDALSPNPEWAPQHLDFLKWLSDETMKDPKGQRSLMTWHVFSSQYINAYDSLWRHPEDAVKLADGTSPTYFNSFSGQTEPTPSLWPEKGIEFTRAKLDHIFSKLKEFGLELDHWTDQHESSLTPWIMFNNGMLDHLPEDSRWPAVATELGFNNLEGVKTFWTSAENRNQLIMFNRWCSYKTAEILDRAFYSMIRKYWPKCIITDYAHYDANADLNSFGLVDYNGWPYGWNDKGPSLYPGACADLNYLGGCNNPSAQMQPWTASLWDRFVYSLNQFKAIMQSSNGRPSHPIFSGLNQLQIWDPNITREMYKEHIIHCALLGAEALEFWAMIQVSDGTIADEILAELDQKISGKREMIPSSLEISWHPAEMRTSLKVNGKIITRITNPSFEGRWE